MVRSQAAAGRPPRHPALAQRRRRLDGRDAGARVGGDVPRPGARRSSRSPPCVGGQRAADRVVVDRAAGHPHGPELARRRLLRRRAGRRSARGARARPHGQPDHVPQRRRLHRPVRPRGGRAARRRSRCGSASRSSATSSTTATSSSAASTPTPTCCSPRRWTCTTSAAAAAASTRRWPGCACPVLAIGVESDILYPLYQSQEIVGRGPRRRRRRPAPWSSTAPTATTPS